MYIALVTETYAPDVNGVARTVARLVEALRARGHRILVVRPRRPGEPPRDTDTELNVAGVPLPLYPEVRVACPIRGALRDRWRREMPDIVHVATEGPLGWSAVRAARDLGLPVTSDFRTHFDQYSEHYGLGWCRTLIETYLRRFHNMTTMTFVPTAALRASLKAFGFESVEVVGRGVDTSQFSPRHRSPELRRAWRVADDAPAILHVGRLAAEKNVQLVFDAFRAIEVRVPGARLIVTGDGPLRARLQKQNPDVLFTGALSGAALAATYASADVFLFPSLTDTFGNVTLEAMASGLVVVAYARGAAQAHIRHGMNGVLVQGNRGIDFLVRACAAAEQHPRLHAMRVQARVTALAQDWESVAQRFEMLLFRAIQQRALTRIEADAAAETASAPARTQARLPAPGANLPIERGPARHAPNGLAAAERPSASNSPRAPAPAGSPPKR